MDFIHIYFNIVVISPRNDNNSPIITMYMLPNKFFILFYLLIKCLLIDDNKLKTRSKPILVSLIYLRDTIIK